MSERITERLKQMIFDIEQQCKRKSRASKDPFLLENDLDIISEKCRHFRLVLKEVEELEAVFDVHTE